MGFSLLPREDQYFEMFAQMSGKLQEASSILVEMLQASDTDYDSYSKKIKSVEHECDELTHNITTKLNSSFITPFDREDIYTLSVALDDVCDYIDAAGRAIVMYNIHESDEHAIKLGLIIQQLTKEIAGACATLEKSKGHEPYLLNIQRLENEADDVYFNATAELFKSNDAIKIIRWKELYEILENATDRCESVGNIIESIILKHN